MEEKYFLGKIIWNEPIFLYLAEGYDGYYRCRESKYRQRRWILRCRTLEAICVAKIS